MSLDLESKLNLQADAESVAVLLTQCGGRLYPDESDSATYWLKLSPMSDPEETYVACVVWATYPRQPPSVKFATEVGGRVDVATAWPIVPGFRPTALDICMPFTEEGFNTHPEWRSGTEAWKDTGNPFLFVASTLQRLLDTRCAGRHQ
jgi:hypothetical protein